MALGKYALVLGLAASMSASAAPAPRCEGRSDLVGPCFEFRGRLKPYNGNPAIRIWPIGTKRLLGVEEPAEEPTVPANVREWLAFGTVVYGTFRVCPLTVEKPDSMRTVCVEQATQLRIEQHGAPGEAPKIIHPADSPQPSNQPLHPDASRASALSAGERRR
jgi:hypothetical protein